MTLDKDYVGPLFVWNCARVSKPHNEHGRYGYPSSLTEWWWHSFVHYFLV